MKVSELDQSNPVWQYEREEHKNRWRGHRRVIYLGPKAQEILTVVLKESAIMNLNLLAPDIQEDVLHLPLHYCGREVLKECELREIAAVVDWGRQREMWGRSCQQFHSSSKKSLEISLT